MHTTFSPDGRSSMRKMCAQAVKLGLKQIAFTEHAEWNGLFEPFRPNQGYFKSIADCRKRFGRKGLRILTGVEVGNPHWFSAESKAFLAQHKFDICIGSVHWLYDNYNIHGPQAFAGREPITVFSDYFEQGERLVRETEVDILAHSDRIWLRASMLGATCTAQDVEGPLRSMLLACVERDVVLELNTKFIGRLGGWDDELRTMLRWYKEAGGEQIAVNSDAHHHTEIGRNFAVAADMLKESNLLPYDTAALL